ncbi:histidine phosphatase family protein [Nitrincola iocasae]|jgi:phosphohistidine phosphatase SixA|uniref:Histidine phosphatase family protein n=2 Tax=Nitrincola iocasae TaxID=2614693 RepID=A0A5J6LI14_9GAMM|nr:histidine phosphatase family protein [Nitrincola iocasae]
MGFGMHRLLLFLVFACSGVFANAADEFTLNPATSEQLNKLREGGYVLFIRHGPTDSAYPDHVPVDLQDCTTQRPLTDAGRQLMLQVGEYMRQAGIPIGTVYSSPLCRAKETADLLFGQGHYVVDNELMYVAALTDAEKQPIIARTHYLLSSAVTPGHNRILVAHGPNMVEVMEYFPVEGTLVIIEADEDRQQFSYIASIEPDHWPRLLAEQE